MAESVRLRILWACAAAALADGTASAVRGAAAAGAAGPRLRRKVDVIGELRAMSVEFSRYQAARQAFESLSPTRPPALVALLRKHIPETIPAEVREAERAEAAGGWTVRRCDVSLEEAPLDQVMAFVADAESQRPPWRVTKGEIRALPQGGGSARVTLRMEALEK
jgi:hypothetical protein